jgi:hypothetical protein
MKVSRRHALGLSVVVAAASPSELFAQTPPAPDDKPEAVFPKLFPQPTGDNGYEEIVQAGDLAWTSALAQAVISAGATSTLRQKRNALADPKVSRALSLLRRGLAKPIRSPRTTLTTNTLFLDFAWPARGLARLLGVYQYVALADGRTSDAVGALRDGLLLAQTVKGEGLIGGLVGVAIESIVLTRLARHLDQMTARDCDRLVTLAREYLAAPDAAINALESERRFQLSAIESLRNGLAALKSGYIAVLEEAGVPPDPLDAQIETLFKNDSGAPDRIVDASIARINTYFDALIANARLAPYQRTAAAEPPEQAPPDATTEERMVFRLTSLTLPPPRIATTKFTHTRVQVQLLGVHGAVRRFRWERDKLPDALGDLRLPPELATDPYTGAPLVYQKTSETAYALSSAGPGKRMPILLPDPPRPPTP